MSWPIPINNTKGRALKRGHVELSQRQLTVSIFQVEHLRLDPSVPEYS